MNDESMKEEAERMLRALPLRPADYAHPFCELTGEAAKFSDFEDGDPQLMREALANVRGIKDRALSSLNGLSWLLQKTNADSSDALTWAQEPLSLLTELIEDMDAIERRIVNRMIEGRAAA